MNSIAIKTIVSKSTIAKTAFTCIVAILTTIGFCQESQAQKSKTQSKVEAYLQKKDANRNGRLEPDEMSSSTRNYLTRMGFDPEKTISISKIVAKADKASRERESVKKTAELKVPGFGVDKESTTGVRSFNSSDAIAKKTAAKTYSAKVQETTRQTLERYDRNRDGSLDKSEMERARWGSPKPSISDLNGDGRLSRTELNERYAAREVNNSSSSSSKYSSSRKEEDRSRSSSRGRSSSSGSSQTSSTSGSSSSRSSGSNSSSSKPKQVDRSKYLKYAQSLMKTYDKDKDGRLSKTELKKMRRPPVGADTDDDGFVSESEFVDSLSGANKEKTASTSKTSTSSSGSTKKSSYRSSRSSSRSGRSGSSSSLGKLDANSDNQIHMHEFAQQWDDDTVAEFYEKDKNGDGIITAAEWSGN